MRQLEHLSYSSIRQYMDCGLQYKFRKVDKLEPEHTSEALVFGSAIHKVLNKFNQCRINNKKVTASELAKWFEEYWNQSARQNENILYSNGNDFKTCLDKGKDLMQTFYVNYPQNQYTVLEVEKEFQLELNELNCPIMGYIDLIEQDEHENIIITEYKTANKTYQTQQIDANDQLTLYNLDMQRLMPESSIMCKIDCLIKTKQPKFEQYYTTRTQEDFNRIIKVANQVAKGIQNEVFIPNTNSWKCGYCEYQTACKDYLNS